MQSILRVSLAFFLGLLFAVTCLADTVTPIFSSAKGATGVALLNDYRQTGSQSAIIYRGYGDPLNAMLWPGSLDTVFPRFAQSAVRQAKHNDTHELGFIENPNSVLEANRGLDMAVFDGRNDNSAWTAADETILKQALASGHEYSPWLRTQFDEASERDPLDRGDFWDHDPKHHHHHPTHHPKPPRKCPDPPSSVPEPSTFPMVGGGLLMLAGVLRQKLCAGRAGAH